MSGAWRRLTTSWTRTIANGVAIATLLCAAPSLRGAEPPAEKPADEPADKPAPPKISIGDQGLSIEGEDGSFQLRLRTLVQSDARFYFDDGEVQPTSTPAGAGVRRDDFLIRRARLELIGKLARQFDFRLLADFAPAAPQTLLDGWLRWSLSPALRIQAGKVKLPVGLEREQTREWNLMTEFGYPTSLVPNRDIGINVQGQVLDGVLAYYAGVFNGTADGQASISDTDDGKSVAARVFATPTGGALEGLGIGIGATHGEQEGLPAPYRTVGQQIFHSWRSDVLTDGTVSRLVPQAYFFKGPFGALGEYAISSQEVVRPGLAGEKLENSAWEVTASWVLTGEDSTFRGVTPKRNADPKNGGWGAWQIVARATELDVDGDAFPLFADPLVSASRARSYGAGVNWYLNPQVRLVVDYNVTELFEAGDFARAVPGAEIISSGGNARQHSRSDEKALFTRVQLRF
jgi:phosphate-selective porin OprO and OprP